jgi:hypothetical protein
VAAGIEVLDHRDPGLQRMVEGDRERSRLQGTRGDRAALLEEGAAAQSHGFAGLSESLTAI